MYCQLFFSGGSVVIISSVGGFFNQLPALSWVSHRSFTLYCILYHKRSYYIWQFDTAESRSIFNEQTDSSRPDKGTVSRTGTVERQSQLCGTWWLQYPLLWPCMSILTLFSGLSMYYCTTCICLVLNFVHHKGLFIAVFILHIPMLFEYF